MSKPTDEFDFEVYAKQIYSVIIKVVAKISGWFITTLSSIKVLSIWIVLAIALIIGLKTLMRDTYQSDFIVKPMRTADAACVNMLWDLQRLIENEDRSTLAAVLELNQEGAEQVFDIDFQPFRRNAEVNFFETTDSIDFILISLVVGSPDILEQTQNAILHYLENNPIYKQRLSQKLAYRQQLKAKILTEIESLDSVKSILLEQASPKGNGIIYGSPPDIMRAYEQALGLYSSQLRLTQEIERQTSFELLKPVFEPSKPEKGPFRKLAILIFGLAFIAAMIHANRKR